MTNKNIPECTIIDGDKYWWQYGPYGPDGQYGQYHRLDGPAIIDKDGSHSWQANGKFAYSFKEYQEITGCTDEELAIITVKYSPFNCDLNPPKETI